MSKVEKYLEEFDKKTGNNPIDQDESTTYTRPLVKQLMTDFSNSENKELRDRVIELEKLTESLANNGIFPIVKNT